MSISVSTARTILMGIARNAGDPTGYTNLALDIAIASIVGDFIRVTNCTSVSASVNILENDNTVDFSSLSYFVRGRIKEASVDSQAWATSHLTAGAVSSITVNRSLIYTVAPTVTFTNQNVGSGAAATAVLTLGRVTSFTVTNGGSGYTSAPTVLLGGSSVNYTAAQVRHGIDIVGASDVRLRAGECSRTGTPTLLGFTTDTSAIVTPTPSADGTLSIVYYPTRITWGYGDNAVSSTINVPEDHVITILKLGGAAALKQSDQEHGFDSPAFAAYRDYRDSMRGADGDGGRSIFRERLR